MFICLYIDKLEETLQKDIYEKPHITPREAFIKYLVEYYENKLATLRDDKTLNGKVYPMSYLMDAIRCAKFSKYNADINGYTCHYDNSVDKNTNPVINYVGRVANYDKQDGNFADFIMTIDNGDTFEWTLNETNEEFDYKTIHVDDDNDKLHGWGGYDVEELNKYTPQYDNQDTNDYYQTQLYSSLSIIRDDTNNNKIGDLKFNVVIPLYQIRNKIDMIIGDVFNWNDSYGEVVVPYGMWICPQEYSVNLQSDGKIRPSWSLMVSTQFKPFPYSNPSNNGETNKSTDSTASYMSFAAVLKNYTVLMDKFNQMNASMIQLSNDFYNIINIINNKYHITTEDYNKQSQIDKLQQEIERLKNTVDGLTSEVTTK